MKKRNNIYSLSAGSSGKSTSRNFLLVFWLFLFFGSGFPALANSENAEKDVLQVGSDTDPTNRFNSHSRHPFSTGSILEDTEWTENKEEEKENSEEEWQAQYKAAIQFGAQSEKTLSLLLKKKSQNRKSIGLFVLHHSWKSYLS